VDDSLLLIARALGAWWALSLVATGIWILRSAAWRHRDLVAGIFGAAACLAGIAWLVWLFAG
jgi:hypothetical protein